MGWQLVDGLQLAARWPKLILNGEVFDNHNFGLFVCVRALVSISVHLHLDAPVCVRNLWWLTLVNCEKRKCLTFMHHTISPACTHHTSLAVSFHFKLIRCLQRGRDNSARPRDEINKKKIKDGKIVVMPFFRVSLHFYVYSVSAVWRQHSTRRRQRQCIEQINEADKCSTCYCLYLT